MNSRELENHVGNKGIEWNQSLFYENTKNISQPIKRTNSNGYGFNRRNNGSTQIKGTPMYKF